MWNTFFQSPSEETVKSATLLDLQLHVMAFAQSFVNQPAIPTLQSQRITVAVRVVLYIYIL